MLLFEIIMCGQGSELETGQHDSILKVIFFVLF